MKMNVAVLFGGKSTEHEISVISAIQAMENMDEEKYGILPVYITKQNALYTGEALRDIQNYRDIPALLKKAVRIAFTTDGTRTWMEKVPGKRFGNNRLAAIDVAFPVVHGTNVEDGTVQGFLRMYNLPVVGCDVLSSAVGMDKYVMKQFLSQEGFPVLPAIRVRSGDYADPESCARKAEEAVGYPLIVKPVNLGSSIGISKVRDREQLLAALDTAFSFADTVLIERAIQSLQEVNCSVLGDAEQAEASVLEEPFANDDILSYKDKYVEGSGSKGSKSSGSAQGMASLKRRIPAEVSEQEAGQIRSLAVRAFQSLGCSGVARIDFMIERAEGKNGIYINEINTIPGSLSFYLWEPAGVPYPQLLDRLIELALKRDRRQAGLTYSFDTNVFALGAGFGGAKGAKGSKA